MTDKTEPWGYLMVWEFLVPPEHAERFAQIYGSDGAWAQLFRTSPEYVGTELIRDGTDAQRYITLDYWTAEGAFERFREEHRSAYATLDANCEQLTIKETRLGGFRRVG